MAYVLASGYRVHSRSAGAPLLTDDRVSVRAMDIPALLRVVRRLRSISQRELAALAGVPPSTIDRVEAGRSDPRVQTLAKILEAVGLELGVQVGGRFVEVDADREQLVDGAGRHFPPHWEVEEVRWLDSYWGWWRKNPNVRSFPPTHTYWKRGEDMYRWMDAT
jgi:transcriptional regulator with XRE-family HTH domain